MMAEKLEKLQQGVEHAEKGLVGALHQGTGCEGPPADCVEERGQGGGLQQQMVHLVSRESVAWQIALQSERTLKIWCLAIF
jgi:hypothetical protein